MATISKVEQVTLGSVTIALSTPGEIEALRNILRYTSVKSRYGSAEESLSEEILEKIGGGRESYEEVKRHFRQ